MVVNIRIVRLQIEQVNYTECHVRKWCKSLLWIGQYCINNSTTTPTPSETLTIPQALVASLHCSVEPSRALHCTGRKSDCSSQRSCNTIERQRGHRSRPSECHLCTHQRVRLKIDFVRENNVVLVKCYIFDVLLVRFHGIHQFVTAIFDTEAGSKLVKIDLIWKSLTLLARWMKTFLNFSGDITV